MCYKKLLSAFILTFFTCYAAVAQRDTLSLQTIADRAGKYATSYPIEKVYVHFDKPYYAAGDTVWLKAYATMDNHQPTQLSKIVYVDVFNDQDSMMVSLKLPLVNGAAPGMIPISPKGWRQGNYRLRAYTMWMLNFDAAYLFNRVLTVGNPIDNDVLTNVSFGTIAGAQPAASVKIQYKDAKGLPYADKKVSWRVELSHDETAKGKGTTDANGYLTINLPPMPPINLTSSTLFTVLDIGNRSVTSTFPLKSASPGKDVQFFPEGGQMIAGVPGKVAFKAIKADGLGIEIKGTVVDNSGQTVSTFTSRHLGMGYLVITPEAGKTYKANITFADGTQASYDLPRVQGSGITINVAKNSADSLTIRIYTNDQYLQANQNKKFYIMMFQGGYLKYAAQTSLGKQVYSQTISKTKFQSGTLQITLFGPNGYPVAERLAFVQRNDMLTLNLATDKALYNRRQPVKLNVMAKNGSLPVEANLSVAVIDDSKVHMDEDAENNIFSSLLLTSDLRGYVEKPAYYFNHTDENTAADLDVLMMTQGYRRFVIRDVLTGKTPKIIAMPESGISITGTLRNGTGLPIFKGNVRLQTPNNNFAGQTTTDADGKYKFNNVMLYDSTQVVINARDNPNSNSLMVSYDGAGTPSVTRITNLPDERLNIDTAMRVYLDNSKRVYANTHQLKEVVIKAAAAPRRLGHLEHGSLTGLSMEPDHYVDAERFKGCTNFITCFAGMVPGLTYIDNTLYVTRDYNAGIKRPMEVYLDGLQVDMPFLQSLDASEVESVEVFYKDGVSGINQRDGTDGVLVINKKKAPKGQKVSLADLQSLLPPPYLVKVTPRGYSNTREFYSPKYEVGKPSTIGVDLRSTIYWNPKVTTDKTTGNTTLQFYNADGIGSYRAIVEGIDKDGNIGHYVYRYKVQ